MFRSGDEAVRALDPYFVALLAGVALAEVEGAPDEISAICGMNIQTVIRDTRGVAKEKLARGVAGRMGAIRLGQERLGRLIGKHQASEARIAAESRS